MMTRFANFGKFRVFDEPAWRAIIHGLNAADSMDDLIGLQDIPSYPSVVFIDNLLMVETMVANLVAFSVNPLCDYRVLLAAKPQDKKCGTDTLLM